MAKHHLILDFETIGQNPTRCPALDCSYFIFDWDRFLNNPYTFSELINNIEKDKFELSHQINELGYKYKKADLQFWADLPKEIFDEIKPSNKDITVLEFCKKFKEYVGNTKLQRWWSRSNTFDPIILDRLFESYNMNLNDVLPYWRVRDTRTFIDVKLDFPIKNSFIPIKDEKYWEENFKLHNSRHDIAADILRLQMLTRLENELDII